MKCVLLAAAVYNVVWGGWVVFFPNHLFFLSGIDPPRYPGIWQCVGMIVGVYGIGYAIAALDPLRHWPIVLVGMLGKVFGPIGMVHHLLMGDADASGRLPANWLWLNLSNDVIWWIPFAIILYAAFRKWSAPTSEQQFTNIADANAAFKSQHGQTLSELNHDQNVFLLFLRHAGCTFCREAMADLSARREEVEKEAKIVLVSMIPETKSDEIAESQHYFDRYSLGDVDRISDPDCQLYRAYELQRGRASQVMGPAVWWRGFVAAILKRHAVGMLSGDGFQMAGAFLIRNDKIVRAFRHRTSADRPDYCELVSADNRH
ncbi:AhpC/TSA family protein [Planctomycetes bacterium CA13]|uniref:AhpC/TSA family protein n=1 Tax=Novipirellula herctigrandis TaxID=2527986 RepID=A0A5C5ZAK3_9BACT|nr:AhpC/TSA family protein [Planctomycetes bacterium CA13]